MDSMYGKDSRDKTDKEKRIDELAKSLYDIQHVITGSEHVSILAKMRLLGCTTMDIIDLMLELHEEYIELNR